MPGWEGGLVPPLTAQSFMSGALVGRIYHPSGHATDRVRFARQIGRRAALAAYGIGFILGIRGL